MIKLRHNAAFTNASSTTILIEATNHFSFESIAALQSLPNVLSYCYQSVVTTISLYFSTYFCSKMSQTLKNALLSSTLFSQSPNHFKFSNLKQANTTPSHLQLVDQPLMLKPVTTMRALMTTMSVVRWFQDFQTYSSQQWVSTLLSMALLVDDSPHPPNRLIHCKRS